VKVSRPPELAAAPPVNSPGSVPFASAGIPSIAPMLGGSPVSIVVPPGGFAGFAQQTAATQALFQRAGRKGGKRSATKRRRKATAKRASAPKRKRRAPAKRGKARLVKGSAAAKRYMASIRKKRRK